MNNLIKVLVILSVAVGGYTAYQNRENFVMVPRTVLRQQVHKNGAPGANFAFYQAPSAKPKGNVEGRMYNGKGIGRGINRERLPNKKYMGYNPDDPFAEEQANAQQQAPTVNDLGQKVERPVVYNRYIFANARSRTRGLGDPIRGDLPIEPIKHSWFNPSAYPSIDLRPGYLQVDTPSQSQTQKFRKLVGEYSGGFENPGKGLRTTSNKQGALSAGSSGIQFSAFP